MEILKIHNNPERAEWAALTERFTREEEEITRQVTEILADVKSGGDRSLREVRPFSRLASEEQLKQTVAPHLAMPSAMEKPMPWAPPVIRATLPCRLKAERSMIFSFSS